MAGAGNAKLRKTLKNGSISFENYIYTNFYSFNFEFLLFFFDTFVVLVLIDQFFIF